MYTRKTYDNVVAFLTMQKELYEFLERDGLFYETGRDLTHEDIFDAAEKGLSEIVVSVRMRFEPTDEEVESVSGFVYGLCEKYKDYTTFRNIGRGNLPGFKAAYFKWSLRDCKRGLPTVEEKVFKINGLLKRIGMEERASFSKGDELVLESNGPDFDTDFPNNSDVSEVVNELVDKYGFKVVSFRSKDWGWQGVVWTLSLPDGLVDEYREAYGDEPTICIEAYKALGF